MRLRVCSFLALFVLTLLTLFTDHFFSYSEASSTSTSKEDAQRLQAETARGHGGTVPKGSEASQVQSEADRKIAEEHQENPQTILAKGVMESEGDKPPEYIQGIQMSEEARSMVRQHLQHRKEDIQKNFEKTSHKATMDT